MTAATDQRQPSLFDGPRGATFDPRLDGARLGRQLEVVYRAMADSAWHTPAEIEAATGANWASASARLRDMRRRGHEVQRRRREPAGAGIWEYRLVVNEGEGR